MADYPRWLFRDQDLEAPRLAQSREEEHALGEGWHWTPQRVSYEAWPRWFGKWDGVEWTEKIWVVSVVAAEKLGPEWHDLHASPPVNPDAQAAVAEVKAIEQHPASVPRGSG